MQLIRWGQAYKVVDHGWFLAAKHSNPAEITVKARFPQFGRGYERKSDFSVAMRWGDVETLIQKFAELNHPDAVKLKAAVQLAQAAEEIGWQPPTNVPPAN